MVSIAILSACAPKPLPTPTPAAAATLAFSVKEANTWNYLFRSGAVAAHLLATSGEAPRIVVAFPAGNAGIGLWFDKPSAPVELDIEGALTAVTRPDGMRGVRAIVRSSQPTLRANAVMSTIRVLRDYAKDPKLLPPEIHNAIAAAVSPGAPLVVRRTTLDGAHHLELRVEPEGGATATTDAQGEIVLTAPGPFEVALTFLQDDPPLTPIALDQLLAPNAAPSERDRAALAFLTYREKMLAGSWRFLTYFGRDTLLSVRMLMPVLEPDAIEGALGAVIDRLDAHGQVAHEEDIGEQAALRNQREGRGPKLDPIFDYKMVDSDFLLAPVVAHYVLDTPAGKPRAAAFLAKYRDALAKNLALVVERATAFGATPTPENLVALKPGFKVGNWRDSEDGLGGGRYAYDVNAVLIPAALAAAARLYDATCAAACRDRADTARRLAGRWRQNAPPLFELEVANAAARADVQTYAAEQGIDPAPALAAIGDQPVRFSALSLRADHTAVPVMNSDDGFALLFGAPPPFQLAQIAADVARPFPAGLLTPVGMVIANPAYVTDPALRAKFARDRYHGAVIWSWQQAMMAAGLARQLERADLPAPVRAQLVAAQTALWGAIRASDAVRLAEHWSWQIKDGKFAIYRFGEGGDAEANAAQLWSTVYLAVQPPK